MTTPSDVNATLAALVDEGVCTVKQIGMWAGCSDRHVYNWLAGENDPHAAQINLIGQKLPESARLRLAAALLRGWGLDVDVCDGEAGADPMKNALRAGKEVNDLQAAVDAAVDPSGPGGRHITVVERQQIEREAAEAEDAVQDTADAASRGMRLRTA